MDSNFGRRMVILLLFAYLVIGCSHTQSAATSTPSLPKPKISQTVLQSPSPLDLSDYAFPESIDPARHYLFYLHGKIIEDQGIPAINPDYGEYEYQAILEKLSRSGFVIVSEQRLKDTDSYAYAQKVTEQVEELINAGVPAGNITIVGASKGGGIVILTSYLLKNKDINFVIMAICDPNTIEEMINNHIFLYGNVLSIYDASDELAGSCQDLFSFSESKKTITSHEEIVLHIGTGHGILFKPLDEWMTPVIQWAGR